MNIQVKRALARIEKDMQKIATHVANHLGIGATEAYQVATSCTGIAELAAMVAGEARETLGRKGAKPRLVRKVRAAFGYMYP